MNRVLSGHGLRTAHVTRIVARYRGRAGANSSKLCCMGFRQTVRRSTLADANERRDWRIWYDLALLLIGRARELHAQDALDLDVNIAGNVYALDSTTIDLCLSLFEWAPFRSTKAAIKLHTLLDLQGNIPSFIHISDGKRAMSLCSTSCLSSRERFT